MMSQLVCKPRISSSTKNQQIFGKTATPTQTKLSRHSSIYQFQHIASSSRATATTTTTTTTTGGSAIKKVLSINKIPLFTNHNNNNNHNHNNNLDETFNINGNVNNLFSLGPNLKPRQSSRKTRAGLANLEGEFFSIKIESNWGDSEKVSINCFQFLNKNRRIIDFDFISTIPATDDEDIKRLINSSLVKEKCWTAPIEKTTDSHYYSMNNEDETESNENETDEKNSEKEKKNLDIKIVVFLRKSEDLAHFVRIWNPSNDQSGVKDVLITNRDKSIVGQMEVPFGFGVDIPLYVADENENDFENDNAPDELNRSDFHAHSIDEYDDEIKEIPLTNYSYNLSSLNTNRKIKPVSSVELLSEMFPSLVQRPDSRASDIYGQYPLINCKKITFKIFSTYCSGFELNNWNNQTNSASSSANISASSSASTFTSPNSTSSNPTNSDNNGSCINMASLFGINLIQFFDKEQRKLVQDDFLSIKVDGADRYDDPYKLIGHESDTTNWMRMFFGEKRIDTWATKPVEITFTLKEERSLILITIWNFNAETRNLKFGVRNVELRCDGRLVWCGRCRMGSGKVDDMELLATNIWLTDMMSMRQAKS